MSAGASPYDTARARRLEQLLTRRLVVTAREWDDGLLLLSRFGVAGPEAEDALAVFLERLTPYWWVLKGYLPPDSDPPVLTFEGWDLIRKQLRAELRGMDQDERVAFITSSFDSGAMVAAALLSSIG